VVGAKIEYSILAFEVNKRGKNVKIDRALIRYGGLKETEVRAEICSCSYMEKIVKENSLCLYVMTILLLVAP
jgi:hypothetical protein